MPAAPQIEVRDLVDYLASTELELDDGGVPSVPLIFVDLTADLSESRAESVAQALARRQVLAVGLGFDGPVPRVLAEALEFTFVARPAAAATEVGVPDLRAAATDLSGTVTHAPRAALTLRSVLAITSRSSVRQGLAAESAAYSMLLRSAEFTRWLASRVPRAGPAPDGPAVEVRREGDVVRAVLNRPARHNAFDRSIRDELAAVLDLVLIDPTISRLVVTGAGRSFCSGGDLDEFGTSSDAATAHLVQLERSVAARLERCRDRVQVRLHGACIGAGIEIPSFAASVLAAETTRIRLPELAMGLIPGAGGTVGITRRIGVWHTAYLALSAATISAATALGWGLVDALGDA